MNVEHEVYFESRNDEDVLVFRAKDRGRVEPTVPPDGKLSRVEKTVVLSERRTTLVLVKDVLK